MAEEQDPSKEEGNQAQASSRTGLRNRRKCCQEHPVEEEQSSASHLRKNTRDIDDKSLEDASSQSEIAVESIESEQSMDDGSPVTRAQAQGSQSEVSLKEPEVAELGTDETWPEKQVEDEEEVPVLEVYRNEINSFEPDGEQVPREDTGSSDTANVENHHRDVSLDLEAMENDELEKVSRILNELTEPGEEEVDEKPRREVYKMPDSVDVGQDNSLIFWPANLVILAVAWQLRIIFLACAGVVSVAKFVYAFVLDPVGRTTDVKNGLSDRLGSFVKPVSSDLLPKLAGFLKRFGWGVLAVAYVVLMLSFLIVPVVLVEYFYIARLIEEPLDVKSPIFFDYTEPRPSAEFRLFPEAGTGEEKFTSSQAFSWNKLHVGVALTLPESDYNRQLGMFQVAAELYSARHELVQRSSRPCMLRYQSVPIRYARTIIYSVPVLLDVAGEYQVLELDLMELRQTRRNPFRVATVKLILEPRAGFKPGAGLPEIYASEIRVRGELSRKKSLLYNWKLTLYVWSATVLFVVELGIVLCCFRQLLIPRKIRRHRQRQQQQQQQQIEVPDHTATRKTKSQVKKRVSFEN